MDLIRARGDRAIIYDKSCNLVEQFYQEKHDHLMNALDERSVDWNLCAINIAFGERDVQQNGLREELLQLAEDIETKVNESKTPTRKASHKKKISEGNYKMRADLFEM